MGQGKPGAGVAFLAGVTPAPVSAVEAVARVCALLELVEDALTESERHLLAMTAGKDRIEQAYVGLAPLLLRAGHGLMAGELEQAAFAPIEERLATIQARLDAMGARVGGK